MAQFTGPSLSELPGWRVGILFILFLVVTVTWDCGITALDRYLRKHGKRGLRHVVKRLQNELLVLGLLSLMLVAFEAYLLEICIPCDDSCSWDCPAQGPDAAGEFDSGTGSTGGSRRLQAARLGATALLRSGGGVAGVSSIGKDWTGGSSWAAGSGRLLLASEQALDAFSCQQAAETCSPGSEPFWSQLAIIQSHIFLFMIALIQILYACVSMLICLWKLRRWRRYERAALQQDLRPLHSRFLPQPGDNAVTHALRCTASMLTDSVNAEVYAALRRLFIERLDLDRGFDFHGFLVEAMEEELAGIVGVTPLLWAIVIVWIMLPSSAYTMLWMTGLSVAALVVVGIKLQSIIVALAQAAYQLYGSQPSVHSRPSRLEGIKMRLQRLSAFKTSSQDANGNASSGCGDSDSANRVCADSSRGSNWRSAGFSLLANGCGLGRRDVAADAGAAGGAAAGGAAGPAAVTAGDEGRAEPEDTAQLPSSAVSSDSEDEEEEQQPGAEVASAPADRGAPPQDASAVAGAAGAAARQQADEKAVEMVGRGSLSFSGGLAGGAPPPQQQEQQKKQQQQEQQQQQQQQQPAQQQGLEQHLGQCLSVDLEAQQQPAQAANGAAAAAATPHPSSAVSRRCCAGLLPRLPWKRASQRQRASKPVQRSQSFAETYRGPDAAALFWFGKPRFAMRIIQVAYLENSLSIAAVLFSVWQHVDFDWQRYGGWPFLVIMVCAHVLLLVFMSLLVLPVYALTTAAGSHSAASVIQRALRKNIKPDLARALQRMSLHLVPSDGAEAEVAAGEAEGQTVPQGSSHGSDQVAQRTEQAHQPADQPQVELLPAAGWGGPPSLARHSAPLPALLHSLSTHPAVPLPTRPAPGGPVEGADASGAFNTPFAGTSLDPSALAAVAAAVSAPSAEEAEDGGQRSITRLMGAMYARQLQRQLERTSARSLRAAGSAHLGNRTGSQASGQTLERGPSSSWHDSQDGSQRRLPRPSSLPQLDAAVGSSAAAQLPVDANAPSAAQVGTAVAASAAGPQQQQNEQQADLESNLSVETCPAAVGARWLPTLLQNLGSANAGGASTLPDGGSGEQGSSGPGSFSPAMHQATQAVPAANAVPRPGGHARQPSASPALQRALSSSSHRTLAEVRGLFDAAHADEAATE